MAEIRPFAAVRYEAGADLSAVSCPPYDVLSPEERAALIGRSPHATARLILPEGEGDARYRGAADLWKQWLGEGVLQQDATPGLYVTRTDFTEPGTADLRLARLGLISLLRLYPYEDRQVLPHERTLSKPKEDRLNLLRASGANFESIMTLVEDPDRAFYNELEAATQGEPIAAFDGDDNQRHTLWKIEDPAAIERIVSYVAPQPVYIADGHHRYETSLAFAAENGAVGGDRPEAFLLNTLISFSDPGMVLLPTHRLVRGVAPEVSGSLFQHLEQFFHVTDVGLEDLDSHLRLSVENQPTFGLILPSGTVYQATARDADAIYDALPADLDPSLQRLDVTILQHIVLDRILGLPAAEVATTDRLAYTRDPHEALQKVRDGEFDVALILGRPPVQAVRDVSLAGEVMPQKSTFFYPKLLSGLVMRKIG